MEGGRLYLKKILSLPKDAKLLLATNSMLSSVGGYTQVVDLIYLSLLGFDAASIGLIASISTIYPIRIIIYSMLADRFGKTKVLAFMYLSQAGYFAIYFFTADFVWFLFAALFAGGYGTGSVIEQALLTEKSRDELRTIAFSTQSFLSATFSIIGNSLSGLPEHLQTVWGLDVISSIKPLFLVGILVSLAASVTILFIKDDRTERGATSTKKHFLPRKSRGLILRLSLSSIMMGVGQGVFFSLVSLWFWLVYKIKLAEIGYVLAASKIVEAPTFLVAPIIASKFGLVKAYLITRLAGAAAFSFMPFMPTPLLASLVFAVRNALMHLGLPLKRSYTMALLSPEERASAASLVHLPSVVPSALATTLGGVFNGIRVYCSPSLHRGCSIFRRGHLL